METGEDKIKQQILSYLKMSAILADTIQEIKSVPSGHLYAMVMGKMDINTYNHLIDTLIKGGVVRREPSHLLVWIGGSSKVLPSIER